MSGTERDPAWKGAWNMFPSEEHLRQIADGTPETVPLRAFLHRIELDEKATWVSKVHRRGAPPNSVALPVRAFTFTKNDGADTWEMSPLKPQGEEVFNLCKLETKTSFEHALDALFAQEKHTGRRRRALKDKKKTPLSCGEEATKRFGAFVVDFPVLPPELGWKFLAKKERLLTRLVSDMVFFTVRVALRFAVAEHVAALHKTTDAHRPPWMVILNFPASKTPGSDKARKLFVLKPRLDDLENAHKHVPSDAKRCTSSTRTNHDFGNWKKGEVFRGAVRLACQVLFAVFETFTGSSGGKPKVSQELDICGSLEMERRMRLGLVELRQELLDAGKKAGAVASLSDVLRIVDHQEAATAEGRGRGEEEEEEEEEAEAAEAEEAARGEEDEEDAKRDTSNAFDRLVADFRSLSALSDTLRDSGTTPRPLADGYKFTGISWIPLKTVGDALEQLLSLAGSKRLAMSRFLASRLVDDDLHKLFNQELASGAPKFFDAVAAKLGELGRSRAAAKLKTWPLWKKQVVFGCFHELSDELLPDVDGDKARKLPLWVSVALGFSGDRRVTVRLPVDSSDSASDPGSVSTDGETDEVAD